MYVLNVPSSFIGEESVADGASCNLTDAPTWIVDPVDGTTNFVHRFVSPFELYILIPYSESHNIKENL